MANLINLALIQEKTLPNKNAALQQTREHISQAAKQGAQLIVLQELHNSPYFCQTEDPRYFDWAEPIPGPSSQVLCQTAQQHHVIIVASLFEKRAAGLYHNTAIVIEKNGQIVGKYRKMHIPDDPGYYEKFYFTPGDSGFLPIQTTLGKLGILVCWDQWFPEAARLMALAGAEILIYPTAIGWDLNDDKAEQLRQLEAWITVQRGHAIANGLPLVSCNRVGIESINNARIQFWGNSFIAGPQGEILQQADNSNSTILSQVIDTHHNEEVRRIWPFLRDRRIDAYQNLLKRYVDKH